MSKLIVVLPRSRRACGRASFVAKDGQTLLAPMRILATASAAVAKQHDNPTRDRTRPFGHPPAGTYLFAGSLPPGYWPKPRRARRFGNAGAILLIGASGEAKDAANNGRRVFYLHGGPSDRKGRLRPTRGGFRMLDRDLQALLGAINDAHLRGDPLEDVEVLDVELPPGRPAPEERALTRKRRRSQRRRAKRKSEEKATSRQATGEPKLGGILPLAPAIALAGKLLGRRTPDLRARTSRREVIAVALLATTVMACGRKKKRRDRASRCAPLACDPSEGLCPPVPDSCWSGGDDSGGDG